MGINMFKAIICNFQMPNSFVKEMEELLPPIPLPPSTPRPGFLFPKQRLTSHPSISLCAFAFSGQGGQTPRGHTELLVETLQASCTRASLENPTGTRSLLSANPKGNIFKFSAGRAFKIIFSNNHKALLGIQLRKTKSLYNKSFFISTFQTC